MIVSQLQGGLSQATIDKRVSEARKIVQKNKDIDLAVSLQLLLFPDNTRDARAKAVVAVCNRNPEFTDGLRAQLAPIV
jgi:hypothetical protein